MFFTSAGRYVPVVSDAITLRDRILGGLWGALVGDALGVPVEFKNRDTLQLDPVMTMRGYGTHRQPPGTWSDDSSLILCTVDSLLQAEFDTTDLGKRFVDWMYRGLWTSWGEPFDVGVGTSDALMRIANGTPAEEAGGRGEYDNGNGSLMRILPVALRFAHETPEQLARKIERASAVTHRHARSQMACVLSALIVRELLNEKQPSSALATARSIFSDLYSRSDQLVHFSGLLEHDIASKDQAEVPSSGYVLHTLTASLWCLLTTQGYTECVLCAVNLGEDTDTTACVAGALAGIRDGLESVPLLWRNALPRQQELKSLLESFTDLILKSRVNTTTNPASHPRGSTPS